MCVGTWSSRSGIVHVEAFCGSYTRKLPSLMVLQLTNSLPSDFYVDYNEEPIFTVALIQR